MSELYNSAISKHYAAYRPPIHEILLNENIFSEKLFQCGLDVGCGTGVSTMALSKYCQVVHGVDPSAAMISRAKSRDGVSYYVAAGENVPLGDNTVDIVTFAGSLPYAKSDALLREVNRVCIPNASVIVYDFEVLLCDSMSHLGISMDLSEPNYDHAINLSDCDDFDELIVHQNSLSLDVSSTQLAHIIFSSSKRYAHLAGHFGDDGLFMRVVSLLNSISEAHCIKVDAYFSMYQASGA